MHTNHCCGIGPHISISLQGIQKCRNCIPVISVTRNGEAKPIPAPGMSMQAHSIPLMPSKKKERYILVTGNTGGSRKHQA